MTPNRIRGGIVVLLIALAGMGLWAGAPAAAQDGTVIVPDVIGLSVPAAAAQFNAHGLALGTQTSERWTAESGLPADSVQEQAIASGTAVDSGTAIDVTVLRTPNAMLMYNTDVITLLNQGRAPLDLNGLEFVALDGSTPARFAAANWLPSLPGGDQCVQLWATRRTGPSRPVECAGIQRWQSTVNPAVHFWTGSNAVTQFQVVRNGTVYAECDAAAPGEGVVTCGFYVPGAGSAADDITAYVYFAYTTDRLIVLNQSSDKWMPLGNTRVFNYNPGSSVAGAELVLGDPAIFENPLPVANVARLAPGQCLFYTNGNPSIDAPPDDCNVIAQLNINAQLIFWAADFEVRGATDDIRRVCPAARDGQLTVCIMPR